MSSRFAIVVARSNSRTRAVVVGGEATRTESSVGRGTAYNEAAVMVSGTTIVIGLRTPAGEWESYLGTAGRDPAFAYVGPARPVGVLKACD